MVSGAKEAPMRIRVAIAPPRYPVKSIAPNTEVRGIN